MRKTKTKILSIVILSIILSSLLQPFVKAVEIDHADVKAGEDCGLHLQYWHNSQWTYVTGHYQYYNYNGNDYPAYCLNADRDGAYETGGYIVNVSEVMSDIRIWRAVTNGYPYKSPSDMGVSNYLDAYMTTKHAVYCILYDREVRSFYHGGDARGNAIVDAIERIVNEARYGTRTPQSANVIINKVGGFVEAGNYYSQTFSVTSAVHMGNYTITNTPNMPVRRFCSRC